MRLGTNARTSPPIHQWAAMVREQLAGLEDVTLIALAGEQYRTVLMHSTWPYEVPMKGLGIGQQLSWLTRELSRGQQERGAELERALVPRGASDAEQVVGVQASGDGGAESGVFRGFGVHGRQSRSHRDGVLERAAARLSPLSLCTLRERHWGIS